MFIHEATRDLVVAFEEAPARDGEVAARGILRLPSELEGPPGRLHGGYHAFVRVFPILERISVHSAERTFPCALDVRLLRSLPLREEVPFEARYRVDDAGWHLTTRLLGTDRLLAEAHSSPAEPLMDGTELARWRGLYQRSQPAESSFEMFKLELQLAPRMVWVEANDPLRTAPESQHAALVEPGGVFGPAFVATQLDMVGAVARGVMMRHPHFTKHITLRMASGAIAADRPLLCLADRTRLEEDPSSETAPVLIDGRSWGTARIPVALVDVGFTTAYATGEVTVHPVDPHKFEPLKKMRAMRRDL